MTTVNRSMSLLEWALLLALSVLWGGSFFFVGVAVKELPPLTIVVLRVALAALALHLVLRLLGLRMPAHRSAWLAFIAMGLIINAVPFSLIALGPDADRQRARLDPQRDHAFVHGRRRAPPDGGGCQ